MRGRKQNMWISELIGSGREGQAIRIVEVPESVRQLKNLGKSYQSVPNGSPSYRKIALRMFASFPWTLIPRTEPSASAA